MMGQNLNSQITNQYLWENFLPFFTMQFPETPLFIPALTLLRLFDVLPEDVKESIVQSTDNFSIVEVISKLKPIAKQYPILENPLNELISQVNDINFYVQELERNVKDESKDDMMDLLNSILSNTTVIKDSQNQLIKTDSKVNKVFDAFIEPVSKPKNDNQFAKDLLTNDIIKKSLKKITKKR